ncbi:MAG: dihydrofolate reductase family protein [Burkholderiaceae bacterium]
MTLCTSCVFIATSLDGYIARLDGSIDWLDHANTVVPPGEDFGYAQFMADVDALVMGRNSFEQVLSFDPWPYADKPVIVLSTQWSVLPAGAPATATLSCESPAQLLTRLAAQGMRRVYVDGGVTIQRFLAAGLVEEMTITQIPVLLGAGRPLFGLLPADVWLEHVATHAYPFGFVQSTYRVARTDQSV